MKCCIMQQLIRVYTVCYGKNNLQGKKYIFYLEIITGDPTIIMHQSIWALMVKSWCQYEENSFTAKLAETTMLKRFKLTATLPNIIAIFLQNTLYKITMSLVSVM